MTYFESLPHGAGFVHTNGLDTDSLTIESPFEYGAVTSPVDRFVNVTFDVVQLEFLWVYLTKLGKFRYDFQDTFPL